MEFMKLVMTTEMTAFKPMNFNSGRKHLTALGKLLPRLADLSDLYAAGYHFHPYLFFLLEVHRSHPIRHHSDCGYNELTADGRTVGELYDDFLSTLREQALEVKLRKKAADWDSKFRSNLKRLRAVESAMFDMCGRIVAIRLDLHHKERYFTQEELAKYIGEEQARQAKDHAAYVQGLPVDGTEPLTGRVSFETVQHDRQRLFDLMKGKPSLFQHLVAYVWRIEFTPGAGYHLHLALFFDGSEVRKHEWLAQQIGLYWQDVITHGDGRFHNCNMAWDKKSPLYGIGVINHGDKVKRAALLNAMDYLCKRSQQVVVLPYKGCKLFGAGLAHRRPKARSGRPRNKAVAAFPAAQNTSQRP
jgi:hypothetical protein